MSGVVAADTRFAALEAKVEALSTALNATVAASASQSAAHTDQIETLWFLMTSCFVFQMQCGFCMLEAGSVRNKNMKNLYRCGTYVRIRKAIHRAAEIAAGDDS